jgi:hypothetical protein
MVSYPLPPWLARTDPAEAFISTFKQAQGIKAQLQMEQARLQQSAIEAGQQAQARASEQQQRMALEQQQIAQEKARTDAELGLKRQQLEQSQQEITMAAQQAANKFAATRAFQAEVGDGSDPDKVSRAMLKYGAAMGAPGAAMSSAMRMAPRAAEVPKSVKIAGEDFIPQQTSTGTRFQQVRHEKPAQDIEARMVRMDQLRELERRRDKLEAEHEKDVIGKLASTGDATSPTRKAAKEAYQKRAKSIDDLDKQIQELQSSRGGKTGSTNAKEVTRKTKDGRLAVFNADTKAFIRYADNDRSSNPDVGSD